MSNTEPTREAVESPVGGIKCGIKLFQETAHSGMISTDNCTWHSRPGTHQILDDETLPQTRVGSCSSFVHPEYSGLTEKILSTPLRLHDQMWNAWILQVRNAQSRKRASLCERVKLNTYTAHESFLATFVFAVDKAGQGTQIKKKEVARG